MVLRTEALEDLIGVGAPGIVEAGVGATGCRADGAVGFYRGAAVRALAQAPSVAIVWTTYELFVRTLSPSPP